MKMRKILILSVAAALVYAGCKKKDDIVSTTVTVSYPIITIAGSQYVSIPVGGSFVPPDATAYDTFYKEHPTVVKDLGSLDNTTPGLYAVTYSAKNHYGFVGTANVYVAVTNISDSLDLTGWYQRNATPGRSAYVRKLARGLFMTDNVGGVDTTNPATGARVSAAFAVLNPTTIDLGSQLTTDGPLSASFTSLTLAPADTEYAYIINLSGFSSTALRTFIKQ